MVDGMTKEKWNQMNIKQKLEYFANYYLKLVIVGVVVVGILISIIVSIVTPSSVAISGQILNISIMKEGYEQYLCEEFLEAEGFEKKATAVAQLGVMTRNLDDSYQTSLTIDVRMEAKELDYFIVDKEGLDVLNEGGMLLDLSTILDNDTKKEVSEKLVELSYADETMEGTYLGAIEITDTKFINEYANKKGTYYIAAACTSVRTENVVKMIKYLFK